MSQSTFQNVYNKDADEMDRLVCTFVIRMQQVKLNLKLTKFNIGMIHVFLYINMFWFQGSCLSGTSIQISSEGTSKCYSNDKIMCVLIKTIMILKKQSTITVSLKNKLLVVTV